MKQFKESREWPSAFCLSPLVFLAAAGFQQAPAQEHDEALKQRFLREAPVQWQEYARRTDRVQGKVTSHLVTTIRKQESSKQQESFHHWEYKTNGKAKLLFILKDWSQKDESQKVYGLNSRYFFLLRRNAANSPWVVIQLIDLGKEGVPEKIKFLIDAYHSEMKELVTLDWVLLAEAMHQPTFRVQRCSPIQRDGEELVEVNFTYPHEVEKASPSQLGQSGTLLLDPKRFWCIRSKNLKTSVGAIKWEVKELAQTSSSLPIPKRTEREITTTNNAAQIAQGSQASARNRLMNEYDLNEPVPLPADTEFTLSAFGLPEPIGMGQSPPGWYMQWYIWTGGAAVLCLALAVVFRRLGRTT